MKFLLNKPYHFLTIMLCLVVGSDQLTKYLIQNWMNLYESIPIINNFFSLTYIRNPGGAFGILADQGNSVRIFFFIITSTIALIFLFVLFVKSEKENVLNRLSLSMILGGAIGNLIDRFRMGEVVDFLDFFIGSYHWPAFNLADSAITIGMVFLFINLVFKDSYFMKKWISN